jgi:hypothetical protein
MLMASAAAMEECASPGPEEELPADRKWDHRAAQLLLALFFPISQQRAVALFCGTFKANHVGNGRNTGCNLAGRLVPAAMH